MTEPAPLSFAEIAVELLLAARDEARSIEDAELLAARLPESLGVKYSIDLMRMRAKAIGEAHSFFKAVSEHEAEILKRYGLAPKPRPDGQLQLRIAR